MNLNRRNFLALLGITPTVSVIMPFSAWLQPEKYDLSMITCDKCKRNTSIVRNLKDCAPIIIDRYGRRPNFRIESCLYKTLGKNGLIRLGRLIEFGSDLFGYKLNRYDKETVKIIEEKIPTISH